MVDVITVVAVVVIWVAPFIVTILKGKYGYAAIGVFIHVYWWVGAIRLARPDSHWARRFYGPDKLFLAYSRFPAIIPPHRHTTIARHMYGLRKDGNHVHSVADIARFLGVSRPTAYGLLDPDQREHERRSSDRH